MGFKLKPNRAVFIGLFFYFILMLVDFGITLSLGDLVQYLEANLIYKYVGLAGILLLNFVIIAVWFWIYKRSTNPDTRFLILNMIVTITVVRILVIYNNWIIFQNPPTLEI
ncbi:unnamed protein product, partial [marine sediment metagenome]